MCEKTLYEQLSEAQADVKRLENLVNNEIFLKDKNDLHPIKIYPLPGQEKSIDNLRRSIDFWFKKSTM